MPFCHTNRVWQYLYTTLYSLIPSMVQLIVISLKCSQHFETFFLLCLLLASKIYSSTLQASSLMSSNHLHYYFHEHRQCLQQIIGDGDIVETSKFIEKFSLSRHRWVATKQAFNEIMRINVYVIKYRL